MYILVADEDIHSGPLVPSSAVWWARARMSWRVVGEWERALTWARARVREWWARGGRVRSRRCGGRVGAWWARECVWARGGVRARARAWAWACACACACERVRGLE